MIYHDYECLMHGRFESGLPECPICSEPAQMIFLKAPSIGTEATRYKDLFLRDLAQKHGLGDLSNRGGDSVMNNVLKGEFKPYTVPIDEKNRTAGGISIEQGQDNMVTLPKKKPRINVVGSYDPVTGKGWRK